jgi:hypothetical protein
LPQPAHARKGPEKIARRRTGTAHDHRGGCDRRGALHRRQLYEKVFERSPLQFEKLTREFMRDIGRRIPDKVRFFIWRQDSHIIAFGLCTVQGERICHEYVGFDYSVAFELNLYYRVFHDIVEWAIANGYKRFYSGSLNYDPKWHLRHSLYPIDLYVRQTSAPINAMFRRLLPLMEPTRSDPILSQLP